MPQTSSRRRVWGWAGSLAFVSAGSRLFRFGPACGCAAIIYLVICGLDVPAKIGSFLLYCTLRVILYFYFVVMLYMTPVFAFRAWICSLSKEGTHEH